MRELPPTYDTWEQVAGYFDGDGNVRAEVRIFVLRFGIRFTDTWREQLDAVSSFLRAEGIKTGAVGPGGGTKRMAYRLDVGEEASVILAIRKLLPLCVKKKADLQIALDYLENRITANQAMTRFEAESTAGRRRGMIKKRNIPFTKKDGFRAYQLANARAAWEAHRVKVDPSVLDEIIAESLEFGLGEVRLSRKYGLSRGVLRRILKEAKVLRGD